MAKEKAKTVKAKKAAPKAAVKQKQELDRKSLAIKARQLKTELLAIRFNLQSPSLKDYRAKKTELRSILRELA